MKIAGFNGFPFHYEMFGYFIHYCREKKYDLTIYTTFHNNTEGYMDIYNIYAFPDYIVQYKTIAEFDNEYKNYDIVILFTDDDFGYNKYHNILTYKTLCIDHVYLMRSPAFKHRLSVRPWNNEHYRQWAMPCYPIYNMFYPKHIRPIKNTVHIAILGDTHSYYQTYLLNRIQQPNEHKMCIHSIGRITNQQKFENLDYNKFDLKLYNNCDAMTMIKILQTSHYMMVGLNHTEKNYDEHSMNGCIPIALSTLIPMIIPVQMNRHYGFKNVIEYDRSNMQEQIFLKELDMQAYKEERNNIINRNHGIFDKYIEMIVNEP